MKLFDKIYKKIKNIRNHYDMSEEGYTYYHHALVVDYLRDDISTAKEYLIHLFNICYVEFHGRSVDGTGFFPVDTDEKYLVIYNYSFPSKLEISLDTEIRDNFCIYVNVTKLYNNKFINDLNSSSISKTDNELRRIVKLRECVNKSNVVTTGFGPVKNRKGNNTIVNEDLEYKKIKHNYKLQIKRIISKLSKHYYNIGERKFEYVAFKILLNMLPEEEYTQFIFLMEPGIWYKHFGIRTTINISDGDVHIVDDASEYENIVRAYKGVVCDVNVEPEDIKKVSDYLSKHSYTKKLFDIVKITNIQNYYTPHILFQQFYLMSDFVMANSVGITYDTISGNSYKEDEFFVVHNVEQVFIIPTKYYRLVNILVNSQKFFIHSKELINSDITEYIMGRFDISVVMFNKKPIGIGRDSTKHLGLTVY